VLLFPVTVKLELPEVLGEVEIVNVELPEPSVGTAIDAGVKLADSPDSKPVTELKVTSPLKWFCEVAVTV